MKRATSGPTVELFVVAHTDVNLATVPDATGITPVDLRTLSVDPGYDDRFAESRFLLSTEAGASSADLIGLCSANYNLKWPEWPHLVDLPRLARHLGPSQALGVELLPLDEWMASAEHNHPGMVDVLDRLTATFGLELGDHRVPGCNTFVCHRDHYVDLLETFAKLLTTALEWYGTDVPFQYRCPDCGTVSDTGFGRWTNSRHIGYLGERITRLIFASMPDIDFAAPSEFVPSSTVGSFEHRLRRKASAVLDRRRSAGGNDGDRWHRNTQGLGDARQAAFTVCPVCAENAGTVRGR